MSTFKGVARRLVAISSVDVYRANGRFQGYGTRHQGTRRKVYNPAEPFRALGFYSRVAKGLQAVAVFRAALHYRWVILVIAILVQTAVTLASLSLAPLAPLFQPELGLSKTEVGLFASAPTLGGVGVMLIAGSLIDRYGFRRLVSLGLVVRGAPLLLMPVVGSLLQAAPVMVAVGVGEGMVLPGPTKAILVWFPPAFRATAMGLKQMGTPIAGIITAAVLPTLGLALGWRSALAAVGIVTIAGGATALFPVWGVGLAVGALAPPWIWGRSHSVFRSKSR